MKALLIGKSIVEMVIKYMYFYNIINYKVVKNYYIDFTINNHNSGLFHAKCPSL